MLLKVSFMLEVSRMSFIRGSSELDDNACWLGAVLNLKSAT